jgi:hypothetical protein
MSRVNSQGLLGFNQAAPSVEIAAPAPQFIESRSVGGQMQVAQPRQQVGPSSEEASYAALAQIAGGVAKGLDVFADIGSRLEKEKVQKAQLLFDEIDADETIDGNTKFTKLEDGLKEIYTPLLGENWKKDINNRVKKQWLSEDAMDSFEKRRYNSELGDFLNSRNLDRNSQITPELLDVFQQEYENRHPLARQVSWYQTTKADNKAKVAINATHSTRVRVKAAVDSLMQLPSESTFNEYTSTNDPKVKREIEQNYPAYFDLANKIPNDASGEEVFDLVTSYVRDALQPQLQNVPDDIKEEILRAVDSSIVEKAPMFNLLKRVQKSMAAESEAGSNIAAAVNVFNANKKTNDLLVQVAANISILPPNQRQGIVSSLVPKVFQAKLDETPGVSPHEIWEKIKEDFDEFTNWDTVLPAGIDYQTWIKVQKDALISTPEWKNRVGNALNETALDLGVIKPLAPMLPKNVVEARLEAVYTSLAKSVGIPEDKQSEFVQYLFSAGRGVVGGVDTIFLDHSSFRDWWNQMPGDLKTILKDNGFEKDSYADLKTKMYGMVFDGINIQIQSGSKQEETGSVSQLRELPTPEEASISLLTASPAKIEGIRSAIKDPSILGQLNEKDRVEMITEIGQLNHVATTLPGWLDETVKKLKLDNASDWNLSAGVQQVMDLDPAESSDRILGLSGVRPMNFSKRNIADQNGRLTPDGLGDLLIYRHMLHHMFRNGYDTPELREYVTDFKTILTNIKERGIDRVPFNELYTAVTIAQAIQDSGKTADIVSSFGIGSDSISAFSIMAAMPMASFVEINSFDSRFKTNAEQVKQLLSVAAQFQGAGDFGDRGNPIHFSLSQSRTGYKSIGADLIATSNLGSNDYRKPEVLQSTVRALGFGSSELFYKFVGTLVDLPEWNSSSGAYVSIQDANGNKTTKQLKDFGDSDKVLFALERLSNAQGTTENAERLLSMFLYLADEKVQVSDLNKIQIGKTLLYPEDRLGLTAPPRVFFEKTTTIKNEGFVNTQRQDLSFEEINETGQNAPFSMREVKGTVKRTLDGLSQISPDESRYSIENFYLSSELDLAGYLVMADENYSEEEYTHILDQVYVQAGVAVQSRKAPTTPRARNQTLFDRLNENPVFKEVLKKELDKTTTQFAFRINTKRNYETGEFYPVLEIGSRVIRLDKPNTGTVFKRERPVIRSKQAIEKEKEAITANILKIRNITQPKPTNQIQFKMPFPGKM